MSITAPDDRISTYQPVVPTTEFAADFPVFDNDDIAVFQDGVERTDFAVSATYIEGVSNDAKAVFAVGITGNIKVIGHRDPRRTNRFSSGPLPIRDFNLAIDTLEAESQEARRDIDRAFKAPYGATAPEVPQPEDQRVLGWVGSELQNLDPAQFVNMAGVATAAQGEKADNVALRFVSVEMFGAVSGGVAAANSAAFQAAINSLPASGGVIRAWGDSYALSSVPNAGTKSVKWDFGPNTAFPGPAAFPRFATNGDCAPAGPYIRSQRAQTTIAGAASFAAAIESIQPVGDAKGYGALFVGAQLNAPGANSINTGINVVATANNGSSGNIWGIEVDVANFGPSATGTQFGLSINGLGGNDVTFGIKIDRVDATSKYGIGVDVRNARIGVYVEGTAGLENALVLGDLPGTRYGNNTVQATQIANGGGILLLQRKTNSSPTGKFISAINADNSAELFSVDVTGAMQAQSVTASSVSATTATAGNVILTAGATAATSGQVKLSAQTTTTGLGTNSVALPANLAGYLVAYIGTQKIGLPIVNLT